MSRNTLRFQNIIVRLGLAHFTFYALARITLMHSCELDILKKFEHRNNKEPKQNTGESEEDFKTRHVYWERLTQLVRNITQSTKTSITLPHLHIQLKKLNDSETFLSTEDHRSPLEWTARIEEARFEKQKLKAAVSKKRNKWREANRLQMEYVFVRLYTTVLLTPSESNYKAQHQPWALR